MDKILNFYNAHEGTSQRTRLDNNLLPEHFQIDGRTAVDMVNFAVKFSESINYYHNDSRITQSWRDFFVREPYVYLYIIANTNLYQTQKQFYQSFELISTLTDKTDISSQLQNLVTPIYSILEMLASWNANLNSAYVQISDFIILFEMLKEEEISIGIVKSYKLSNQFKTDHNWNPIDSNFSLNLFSAKNQSGYNFEEGDLNLFKNLFKEIYLLAESVIKQAKIKISEEDVSNQNVLPHIALFIGFLKVYEILQNRMNGITKRHLDYYYEEILKLTQKGIRRDETYVRFEMNAKYDSYFLKKGTAVAGSKDKSGVPIVYETIHDALLSNVKIAGLHTLFVSQNSLNYTGLPDQEVVTDIFFKKHDPENIGSMSIFGEDQFFKASSERSMETAQVGFMVASDKLYLAEGERTIYIDLISVSESYESFVDLIHLIHHNEKTNKDDDETTFYKIFSTAFDVFIVLDGVEKKQEQYEIIDNPDNHGITMKLFLSDDELPVTELQNYTYLNQPNLKTPYVKVLLREESHIYAFFLIQKLDIANIKLRIEVEGLKNFLLFNNYGQIDPSAPFQLFGTVPKVNSYFLLGSKELFRKPLTKIDINLQWYQLPSDSRGWSGYFSDYDEKINNSDYKVEIEYLNSGIWKKLKSESVFSLFEEEKLNGVKHNRLSNQTRFENLELQVDFSENIESGDFESYSLKTRNGYFKLELISPEFAFGYNAYQKNIYNSIRDNARLGKDSIPREPNLPSSPLVKSITVNYNAEIEAVNEKGHEKDIQLFSLGPFGYKQRRLKSIKKPVKLLLDLKPEGHLMIGLNKYPKDGKINFFFNPDLSTVASINEEVPVPKWQFLENNEWVDIPLNALFIDNTKGFLQSGIISIKIPDSITNNNTLINDSLFWIRASVEKNSHIAPEMVGIHTNVARIKWDKKSDGSHLHTKLSAKSINKMHHFDPKIISVEQLLEPFNGATKEPTNKFYARVSERLRHKNRAYTNWDYERLLLARFPEIFKAKCFNPIDYKNLNKTSETIEPGELLIAVIPSIDGILVANKLRPKFGINFLLKMQKYLQEVSSPFVKIKVVNPQYEKLRIICKIKFGGRLNPGYYISLLNKDITEYLTPWIASENMDEQFGNSQYRSKIFSFINQKDFVKEVTSFSVVKTNTEQGNFKLFDTASKKGPSEVISPEFPWSILTSVEQHDISSMDNFVYQKPVPRGIGNMKLGVDFGLVKKTND